VCRNAAVSVTPPQTSHENHEAHFKNASFPGCDRPGDAAWGRTGLNLEEHDMRWETPKAVDLRFGMEITMYISNR
jgi:coenzyme PQQ precursor peptide PqqA